MSLQFNHFAADGDAQRIIDVIVAALGEDVLVVPERTDGDFAVHPLQGAVAHWSRDEVLCLVRERDLHHLVIRGDGRKRVVDLYSSPVIEWSPSHAVDSEVLKVGRLRLPSSESALKPAFAKIVRELNKLATTHPQYAKSFRFFPSARNYSRLQFWVGPSVENAVSGQGD